MPAPITGTAAYVRLSREDVQRGERIEQHVDILLHLAERHGLLLAPSDIEAEIEQSDRLDTRAGVQRILARCRAREVSHLFVSELSRLTRGEEDQWAAVKRALFRGRVTLITPRHVAFFDDQLDTTQLDLEAVLARRERWQYSLRRREHNLARTRRGKRSCSFAPFGYRWISATYDAARRPITPGRVEVDADEWPILCELFRRARTQGLGAIAEDLNARGIPTSGMRRNRRGQQMLWSRYSIRQIVTNPWYAGRVVHRHEQRREQGLVALPRAEWVLSDEVGDWPTPVTEEEWLELQDILAGRQCGRGLYRSKLLAGILYCCEGSRMAGSGEKQYRCYCVQRGTGAHRGKSVPWHPGAVVSAAHVDAWVKRVVEYVLAHLGEGDIPEPRQTRPRSQVYGQIAAAQRELDAKRRQLDDLIQRSEDYLSLPDFGRERYQANLKLLSEQGQELQRAIERLRAEASAPDVGAVAELLRYCLRNRSALWSVKEGWGEAQHRLLVRAIVERVDLDPMPEGARYVRSARATLQPYLPPRLARRLPAYKGRAC